MSSYHVLPLPPWTIALRGIQLFVALVILGLAAYGLHLYPFDGVDLITFVAIATIIITVYIIVATYVPIIYNYWAILGLDIFAVIFWLVSFAYLASEMGAVKTLYDDYYNSYSSDYSGSNCYTYSDGVTYCTRKRDLSVFSKRTSAAVTDYQVLAAAAGLGGLEFALFIATLVLVSINLHRHRSNGGHCTPGRMDNAGNDPAYGTTYQGKPEDLRPEAVL